MTLDGTPVQAGEKPPPSLSLREKLSKVAQLARASSQYTKVAGSIPGQGTY